MSLRPGFLLLGVGNELFTDEGLGVAASRLAANEVLASGASDVEVIDGGTLGLGLVPALEDRDGVVVLDAVVAGGREPGTVLELDPDDLTAGGIQLLSAHQLGLAEALAVTAIGGRAPQRVALIVMVPEDLSTGFGVTPRTAARLPALAARALEIVSGWRADVSEESVHA